MRSSSLRLAKLILGVLPGLIPSGTCRAESWSIPEQPPAPDVCDEARRILDDLAVGSIAEVWNIVEAAGLPDFDAIGDAGDDRFASCRDLLIEKLKRVVSRTDDDRVVARILDEIDFGQAPLLAPVVQRAVRHPSPDVRRRMLRAVTSAADPLLAPAVEARFELERDARTRRELIRALAATESRRFLAELRDLATSDDAPLRHAALQAVLDLPDATSAPFLAEIASSPLDADFEYAGRIVPALVSWNDVPGVDEALVRIGRDAPDQVAQGAITGLARRGLDAVSALAGIANSRERTGDDMLSEAAQAAILELQDDGDGTETITIACGGSGKPGRSLPLASVDGDELSDAPVMIVRPADGSETARCWDAPGFMWPDDIRPRVPAGAQLEVFDEFAWGGEHWLASLSVEDICWIRDADLAADAEKFGVRGDVAAYEFDLPITDLNSWAAGTLEHRGWLRLLSAEDPVAAVRLAMDTPTRERVAALIEIRRGTDAPGLVAAIDRWLWRYATAWTGDDELSDAIPRHDPRWRTESEDDDE